MFENTDREWEKFGETNPYFGVLTMEQYHKENLTDENIDAFFKSGRDYVADILSKIKKYIDPTFNPKNSLDFGCGVGRLVVSLAEISENVVGVDVSESMLNEARRVCLMRSVNNIKFVKSDDNLSLLTGKYNFIHSFIVFQHIHVKRGEKILENLLARLEKEGVCVLHFTYATADYRMRKTLLWFRRYIPFARNLINLARGRKFFAPTMQMNLYDLNKIFFMMQKINVRDFYAEYTNHDGNLGVLIYFKIPQKI